MAERRHEPETPEQWEHEIEDGEHDDAGLEDEIDAVRDREPADGDE